MFSLDADPQFKRNQEFHDACRLGDKAKAIRLLDENPDDHYLIDVTRSDFPAILQAAHGQFWDLCIELINRGVDLNVKNRHGYSPLHVFAQHGHEELITLALDAAAFVHRKDAQGRSALYFAAQADKLEACKLLMSHNADPNSITVDCDSPMHCASRNGNTALAKLLIEAGGYAHCENDLGETPITLAKTDEMRAELEAIELQRVMREADTNRLKEAQAQAVAADPNVDLSTVKLAVEEAKPKRRILKA